jgi:hypothetical protein
MSLHLAVDFDADDWVGFHSASDAYNNFGTGSVSISALLRQANGAGGSAAAGTAFSRYGSDRAKYGKDRVNWTTGTAVGAYMLIGSDGATFTMPSMPAGTYTGVVWARLASGSSSNAFRLDMTDVTSTTYGSSSSAALTTTWQKFTVTAAKGGAGNLALSFARTTGTTTLVIEITGAMVVFGSVAPTWFNCGPASLLQDITDYFLENSKWGLGFVKAYQYVAPVGKADLRLSNADKRFSPEYSSGPLYGDLLPNLLVQISDPDYGIWWTGWTDSWAPEPGTNRDKYAVLRATDARRFLANKLPVLELYTLEVPELIVADIMSKYSVPNSVSGLSSGADGSMALDAFAAPLLEWYADDVPYDHDGVKVLADIMGGVQAHFWFGRTGGWTARLQQGDDTPAAYVAMDQLWTDIGNIETGVIINKCEVITRKRKYQSSGPYTVWEADDAPFTIAGSGTEVRRVFFKYDNTRKEIVGAGGLAVVETNSGVAGDITAALSDIGANSAVVTFTNNNAASRDVTAASITASDRVAQLREFSKEYSDSASITANGSLSERLDFSYVQDKAWAKQLARYRVTRFKDARYEVPWIEIDVDENTADAFACYVGAAVHVEDDQTGHDDYYAVIGEHHTVRDGLTNHTVKLYLEPLYPTTVNATSSA